MSADELRQAAALMRERHAAIGGSGARWRVTEAQGHNRDSRRTLGTFSLVHDDVSEVAIVRGMSSEREAVAPFIAACDPTFLLAVADLLDRAADDHDETPCPAVDAALAVARAYLGETP